MAGWFGVGTESSSKIVEDLTKEYMLRDARQSEMLEEAANEAFLHSQAKEQALRERAEAVQALELAIQGKLETDKYIAVRMTGLFISDIYGSVFDLNVCWMY